MPKKAGNVFLGSHQSCRVCPVYDSACESAQQHGVSVPAEPYTQKQWKQCKMDLPMTEDEVPEHVRRELAVAAAERRQPRNAWREVPLTYCEQSTLPRYRLASAAYGSDGRLGLPFVKDSSGRITAHRLPSGAEATQDDRVQDAHTYAQAFCADVRKLQVLNHTHDCTETCFKYARSSAKDASRKTKQRKNALCRFWFFHVVPAALTASSRPIRRRGKVLVPEPCIAGTDDHGEFGRVLPRRERPFTSSTNDAAQSQIRGNVDVQFLPRSLPPAGDIASETEGAVMQESSAAMLYGFNGTQISVTLRTIWSSVVAAYRAAHNCDYYITKYQAKMCQTLLPIMQQMYTSMKRWQQEMEQEKSAEKKPRLSVHEKARKTALKLASAANRCYWHSFSEIYLMVQIGDDYYATHVMVTLFTRRLLYMMEQMKRVAEQRAPAVQPLDVAVHVLNLSAAALRSEDDPEDVSDEAASDNDGQEDPGDVADTEGAELRRNVISDQAI